MYRSLTCSLFVMARSLGGLGMRIQPESPKLTLDRETSGSTLSCRNESAEMNACRVILAGLCANAFAIITHAQAAVEYAAKTAGSALSNPSETHLGVCAIDSTLIPCVK